jgi:uncharacterized protein YdeI (YjbR/CyaY-like superfamily)
MNELFCRNSSQWRKWLQKNHAGENEIWLVFYKDNSMEQSLDYDGALEEALCFGWIDSIIKRIDEAKYVRKFSRRKPTSSWSMRNKAIIKKLIQENRMADPGFASIEVAKANGSWTKPAGPKITAEVPDVFQIALDANKDAKEYFNALSPSHRSRYIMWIANAKKKDTIQKRVAEAISLLEKKKQLGLK